MSLSVKNMLGGGNGSLKNIWGKYEQTITPAPIFNVVRNPNNSYGMMLSNVEGSAYDVTALPLSFFDGFFFENSSTVTLYFTYSNDKLYYGSKEGSKDFYVNVDTVSGNTRIWNPNLNSITITTSAVEFRSNEPDTVDNTFIEYVSDNNPSKYPNYAIHTDGYWYQRVDDVKVSNGKERKAYALNNTISPYNFVRMDGKFDGHGDIIEPWEEVIENYYTAQGVSGVSLGGDKVLFQHTRMNGSNYTPYITVANITDSSVEILSDTVLDTAQASTGTSHTIPIDESRFLCGYYRNSGSCRYRIVTVDKTNNTVTVSESSVIANGVNGYRTLARVSESTFIVMIANTYDFSYYVITLDGDTLTISNQLMLMSISSPTYPYLISDGDNLMLLYSVTNNYYTFALPLAYSNGKVTLKTSSITVTGSSSAYGLSACLCGKNIFITGRTSGSRTNVSGTLISFDGAVLIPMTTMSGTTSGGETKMYAISPNTIIMFYMYGNYNFYSYSIVEISNTITVSNRVNMSAEGTSDRYNFANLTVCDIIEGDGFFAVPSTTNASYYYLKLTRFNVNKGLVLADGNSDGLLVTKATTTEKGTYWSY